MPAATRAIRRCAAGFRALLTEDLRRHNVPDPCVDEVTLVASELFGNAVRHAAGADDPLDVSWDVSPAEVVVQVTDSSPEPPVVRHVDPSAISGRGMAIVETICTEWGVDLLPEGKRVWARVPLAATA